MHTITLNKTHTTQSCSLHVQLGINGRDSGVLYLTPNEAELLMSIIQQGTSVTGNKFTSDINSDSCFDSTDTWEVEE